MKNYSYSTSGVSTYQRIKNLITGESKEKRYVNFGDDNLYPQDIISLVENSTDDSAIYNRFISTAYGEGFITPDPENFPLFNQANRKYGQSLNEVLWGSLASLILGEGIAVKLVTNEDGELISIFNVDWGDWRYAINSNGDHNGFITSNNWRDSKTQHFFPKFNIETIGSTGNVAQIYEKSLPSVGRKWYNLSRIHGNRINIDTHTEQEILLNDLYKDGNFVTTLITTYEKGDPKQIALNHAKLRKQITGTKGRKALTVNAPDRNSKPDFDIVTPNIQEIFSKDQSDLMQQKKAMAWRIPYNLAYNTPGQGFQREDKAEAMNFFLNQEILPLQNFVTDFFNGIFSEFGIESNLQLSTVNPFTPVAGNADGVEEQPAETDPNAAQTASNGTSADQDTNAQQSN